LICHVMHPCTGEACGVVSLWRMADIGGERVWVIIEMQEGGKGAMREP
jgi:hypothetical protein